MMRMLLCIWWVLLMIVGANEGWQRSLPGWKYEFPRDHLSHRDFKTEWWYFTGHLESKATGKKFGYQLTFFEQGVRPPDSRKEGRSEFIVDHLYFAHFAISDLDGTKFYAEQKINRGVYGMGGSLLEESLEAGANRIVWLDDWELIYHGENRFSMKAGTDTFSLALEVDARKPMVFHGADGVSPKSEGVGNATHYYSLTRMESTGELMLGNETFEVVGESWFDREWGSNLLADHQVGWDWFSIQFEDNTELMLFQLRQSDGTPDEFSSGTFVDAAGKLTSFKHGDFTMAPLNYWKSADTGGKYPVDWKLSVPVLGMDLEVQAVYPEQELVLNPLSYWEGAIDVKGKRNGKVLKGQGYLEMTGYAGEIVGVKGSRK